MSPEHRTSAGPRVTSALAELEELLRARYPDATFRTYRGEDPDGYYLEPAVDADVDDVLDVVMPQLLAWSMEELPVYVVPVLPTARVAADLRQPPIAHRGRIVVEESWVRRARQVSSLPSRDILNY